MDLVGLLPTLYVTFFAVYLRKFPSVDHFSVVYLRKLPSVGHLLVVFLRRLPSVGHLFGTFANCWSPLFDFLQVGHLLFVFFLFM